ncbi:MAG: glycosyltransferase [Wenyingzhuangia sp.]|jgi:spore maturation protein CgeB|uniref:glycosyltransferase family protein n=1 Tax=Wenyingzhuangia sp. TaxID=1964193 RepID=UPI00321A487E
MKILISSDGYHAHYYQRQSWANAFSKIHGVSVALWDCNSVPAFDAFDSFEPDIFLGQLYNLTPAVIKCIKERPHLKIGLRAGDWGDHEKEVDKSIYNILYATKDEIETLKRLQDETGQISFVHIHYPKEALEQTHNYYESIGVKVASIMMCADVDSYASPTFDSNYACDIGFVGGYWPYKGQVIEPYLFPLLENVGEYNVKIFGNQNWYVNQYCGLIKDNKVKDLFASAKICPNLSEPHAQKFGFDVNERIFKVLCAGGFCISDNVEGYKMFGDNIVIAESPRDFKEKVDYYLKNDSERNAIASKGRDFVLKNHSNQVRAMEILKEFKNR